VINKITGFVDGRILNEEFNDSSFIMCEAVMASKLSYVSNKFKRQYNLYGDPALNLWPAEYVTRRNKTLSGVSDLNNNSLKYKLFDNYRILLIRRRS
jgi:hypothetical protein